MSASVPAGPEPGASTPRDEAFWARDAILEPAVAGFEAMNVRGRRLASPVQGFGSLWQKTYRVRLEGCRVSPGEVVAHLKGNLPSYLPANSRFVPLPGGVAPGEVVLIDANVSGWPVHTGVMVLYSDGDAFTLICPEGHPEAGWNTFGAFDEDGVTVVQIQSLSRTADPIYKIGARYMGGARQQERIWQHVLRGLAHGYGSWEPVRVTVVCLDPKVQWSRLGNVWQNAMMRTVLYRLASPLRMASRPIRPVVTRLRGR